MTLTLKHFDILASLLLSQGEDNLNERAYHLRTDGPQHLSVADLRDAARSILKEAAERLGVGVESFTQAVAGAHRECWWSDWAVLADRAAAVPKGWTEIVA